ncbi:MAG: hypothetical protein GXO78_14055 [Calditrichaeota bacterium]|nr:hypothetical protein [Calditrichota bacterium]
MEWNGMEGMGWDGMGMKAMLSGGFAQVDRTAREAKISDTTKGKFDIVGRIKGEVINGHRDRQ